MKTPSYLRLLSLGAADRGHTDLLTAMHQRRLDGFVLRRRFQDLDRVVDQLEAIGPEAREELSSGAYSFSIGKLLVTAPDFDDYLDGVGAYRERIEALMPGAEARIMGLFSEMFPNHKVALASSLDGRPYPMTSIRNVPAHHELPAHYEREQYFQPGYADLLPRLDPTTLYAWFVQVSKAEAVPAMMLYDLPVVGEMPHFTVDQMRRMREKIERFATFRLPLEQGDLFFFDAGRRYHRVAHEGDAQRWTMGGFAAVSLDGQTLLVWT